ncbi:hypothetical protein [Longimicrobium terrae]|uniref:Lipoprotein n=1 Tax=Longimicrobium terrae TaxID=1639882 RepID=A0A841H5T5_9BACT|nr:hypothetical protein [Longimicrobium terrae]MBB4639061.1 hypothetical protein [Longimicrobium terrae]MBB6073338.1 hypothetical protein [Longimicrobium terrae]NNC28777.1 hypothetical protein [Longimicrobium terrae]
MKMNRWMMLAVLSFAGCASATGAREADPNAAILSHYGDPVEVIAPESATAGQPFTVAIRTYGGGCIRQGTTDVSVRGRTADLRPRDTRAEAAGAVCTADLRLFRHEASVRIDEPGRATLRVHGVRVDRGGDPEPLVITRTVTVR